MVFHYLSCMGHSWFFPCVLRGLLEYGLAWTVSQPFITGAAASTSLSPGAEHLLRRALSVLVRALGGMGQRLHHSRAPAAYCPQAAPTARGEQPPRGSAGSSSRAVTAHPGSHRCPCWDRAGLARRRDTQLAGGAVAVYEYIGWWVARGQEGTLGGGN